LSDKHKYLSIYGKEFLALILVGDRWRTYLPHQEFTIKIDHRSLSYLEDQHFHLELQKKAMTKMMDLQFKIVYKQGKDNVAADFLSRFNHVSALQAISEVKPVWILEVINSYSTDSHAQSLLYIAVGCIHSPNEDGYSLHNGLIHMRDQIWIGNNTALHPTALHTKLIVACHTSAMGGHSRVRATNHRIKRMFVQRLKAGF
jgi:hypothetical protein